VKQGGKSGRSGELTVVGEASVGVVAGLCVIVGAGVGVGVGVEVGVGVGVGVALQVRIGGNCSAGFAEEGRFFRGRRGLWFFDMAGLGWEVGGEEAIEERVHGVT